MRVIVLAGSIGSRLHPLTTVTKKYLRPVGNYPMTYHPMACLKQVGITEILIVMGRDRTAEVMELPGWIPSRSLATWLAESTARFNVRRHGRDYEVAL